MQHLLIIIAMGLALACSKVGSLTGDSSDASENKPKGDSERPSDVGEGVPGYLTGPDDITFVRDGDKLTINAPAGTVHATAGDPRQVPLTLLTLTAPDIAASTPTSVTTSTVSGITAGENGAIEATVTVAEGSDPFVLQVGEPPADGTLVIKDVENDAVHAVFNDLGGDPTAALDLALWAKVRLKYLPAGSDGGDGGDTSVEPVTKNACQLDGHFWDQSSGKCITHRQLVNLKYCWPSPDLAKLKSLVSDREPPEEDADDDLETYKEDGYALDQCYTEDGDPSKVVINLRTPDGKHKTVKVSLSAFDEGDIQ